VTFGIREIKSIPYVVVLGVASSKEISLIWLVLEKERLF